MFVCLFVCLFVGGGGVAGIAAVAAVFTMDSSFLVVCRLLVFLQFLFMPWFKSLDG